VVDNGSTDDSVDFLRRNYPEIELLTFPRNLGFAPAVNAGIAQAHSDYIVLLNVDTIPQPRWLETLVSTIEQSPPDVGSLASKMLRLEDPTLIDDAGDILSWYGSALKRGLGQPAKDYNREEEIFSACAGAALYRRTLFENAGNFDEAFGSYLEDIDLGLRAAILGYRCLFVPSAEIYHQGHGAGIAKKNYVYLMTRNRLALIAKSIPWKLLFKHSGTLLYGQFYYLLAYKKPLYSLKGFLSFIISLPHILKQRQRIQQRRRVSDQEIDAMLTHELGEIPLKKLIKNKLQR
jgi:GT2 family glycosyltransferase